jgi:hypothetical protein
VETADFSNAELGDCNIAPLCEVLARNSNLKNLKLLKNKITDESLEALIKLIRNAGAL